MAMNAFKTCKRCKTTNASVKICARCRKTSYCSKDCQRKDWPQHKKQCKKPATQMLSAASERQPADSSVMESTTTREPSPGYGDLTEKELIETRRREIGELSKICGEDDGKGTRLPLRVVIVGKHGAGKSSFINLIAAALSEDRWHEYACTGDLGQGAPITIVTERYEKCCNGDRDRYSSVLLPTLIDVAGLNDERDDKMEELLRLLFYGHIKEHEAIMSVYEGCKDLSVEKIRAKYRASFPNMKTDRVIFVASAAEKLPHNLIRCVHRAARPSHDVDVRRAIPVFGVLTKKDKIDITSMDIQEKEQRFIRELGLNSLRFLVCSNYCDDIDPRGLRKRQLRPDLDIPIVQFLQQVVDPARSVTCEDESLPVSVPREEIQNDQNEQRLEVIGFVRQLWQGLDTFQQDCVTASLVVIPSCLPIFPVPSNEDAFGRIKLILILIFFSCFHLAIFYLHRYLSGRGT